MAATGKCGKLYPLFTLVGASFGLPGCARFA